MDHAYDQSTIIALSIDFETGDSIYGYIDKRLNLDFSPCESNADSSCVDSVYKSLYTGPMHHEGLQELKRKAGIKLSLSRGQ